MRKSIRNRRRRQIEADVAILEKAIEDAPLGDPSDEKMAEIYAGVKARRKKKSPLTAPSLDALPKAQKA